MIHTTDQIPVTGPETGIASDNVHFHNRAVMVEDTRTAWRQGRLYGVYVRIAINAGQTTGIRLVCNDNYILHKVDTVLDTGWLNIDTLVGAGESGTWSEITGSIVQHNLLPVGPLKMADLPSAMYVAVGGVFSGGKALNIQRNIAYGGANRSGYKTELSSKIGVPRNTTIGVQMSLPSTGAPAIGVMYIEWEERLS